MPLSKQRGSARQHQREVPLTGPIREAFRDKSATPFDVPASADEKVGSKDHGEPIVSPRTTRFRRWLERAAVYAGALGRKIARPRSFSRAERQALVQQEEIKLVYGLFPAEQKDSPRVVLFAGIECDCDSARICARTAELLAARGEGTVCAVDVNLRSPSLHQYFFMDNACGLAEAAMESGPIFSFARKVADSDLWLLPAGVSPSASNHHAMAERLKVRFAELRASFRYVIVHAGPLRYDSDSLLLSRWTDGVVLVVEADSTLRKSAGQLKESLASMQVGVLGVVLNNRRIELPEGLDCRL